MEGKSLGVVNSNWKVVLTLNADAALRWKETGGSTVGSTRDRTWQYDGSTLAMARTAPFGGNVTLASCTVSPNNITGGSYTIEGVSSGTWSAWR
jgi:hypothetical protein